MTTASTEPAPKGVQDFDGVAVKEPQPRSGRDAGQRKV